MSVDLFNTALLYPPLYLPNVTRPAWPSSLLLPILNADSRVNAQLNSKRELYY